MRSPSRPRVVDPPEGDIVTANQDLNHLGVVDAFNMPMGDYRVRRITTLLEQSEHHDLESFYRVLVAERSPWLGGRLGHRAPPPDGP